MQAELGTSVEQTKCELYLKASADEADIVSLSAQDSAKTVLFTVQGFEERSVGILEAFAGRRLKLQSVVIARYDEQSGPNSKYRGRFERAAALVAQNQWRAVQNRNNGDWVRDTLRAMDAEHVIIDITGVSNRALFAVLDAAAASGRRISIAYSEAGEYWPRYSEWQALHTHLSSDRDLAQVIDEKPWLFGHQHRCELVQGHEGYDSAGTSRALVAFLPFKPARLAAVLGEEEYSAFFYIAGRPRLRENQWRLDALKTINAELIRGGLVMEMDTFGYRQALRQLADVVFSTPGFLNRFDVHMAIFGSKLQVVACWVLSCIVRSITIVTSVPSRYYSKAFSTGIGARWIFPLTSPFDIHLG
jgi:hypothetical protein